MRSKLPIVAAVAVLALPALAAAHVVAVPNTTTVGAYTAVAFRVGHACSAGETTTAVRIEIPSGVNQPRHRAIPGWRVATEKASDGRISAIVWRGRLPDDQFQLFEIFFKAPNEAGRLYFPTVQTCGRDTARWTEIPSGNGAALSHPGPVVTVAPAAAGGEHHHH